MRPTSGTASRPVRLPFALRRKRPRGMALVSVLLVLALLGVIATSFLREARGTTTIARNLVENAKAEALADAGVERAMLGLLDTDRKTAWQTDGRSYEFALGEGTVRVRLQNEAGKLDLNRATDRLLHRLFLAVGMSEDEAAALVDGILAFRRQRGPGAGEGNEVADGSEEPAFENLDQLLSLSAMRRDLAERLLPYLTVYSGRDRVDPAFAPPLLRQLLADEPSAPAEASRAEAETGSSATGDPAALTVSVVAEASTAGGGRFLRQAVLRRTDDPGQPFRILLWRQRWASSAAAP